MSPTPKTTRRTMTAKKRNSAGATVAELHAALHAVAPFDYAAEWDNVGLLAGRRDAAVRRVGIALDLTDAVVQEALRARTDALVLYHPPIFKGIRAVTAGAQAPTTLLPDLLGAGVALLALHTALDAAPGGTNDLLLDAFAVTERYPLEPLVRSGRQLKLVVFVPGAETGRLRTALSAAGAGVIGHYDECSYMLAGEGTFRGDATTNPTIGQRQQLERVAETRLEMIVPQARVGAVVRALYAAHSYEEPAFDLYPLQEIAGRGAAGMGRVGVLRRPTRGTQLAEQLGRVVDLAGTLVVGDLKRRFERVVAAAGAYGVERFTDPDTLVITGEFKHHDALALLKRGVTALHLGHDASERPVLSYLQRRLKQTLPQLDVAVSKAGQPPLKTLKTR